MPFRRPNRARLVCETIPDLFVFSYVLGVGLLEQFIDEHLIQGRATFSREEAESALGLKKETLTAALVRLVNRKGLASPRKGFFLMLRPEDRSTGAPDQACRWRT